MHLFVANITREMSERQAIQEAICGICARRFHHTQVAVHCMGCKQWLHGSCCKPVIKKRDVVKYQNSPFVCHKCSDLRNLEGSVHDGTTESSRLRAKRPPARARTQPLPAVNINTDQLLERIERLELLVEQLTAKNSLYEKRLREQTENGVFWDKQLEDKARKLDDMIKKLSAFASLTSSCNAKAGLLDVVICNIPEAANEDTGKVARAVFTAVEPAIDGGGITKAARVPTSNPNGIPLIKATVKDEKTKGKIIKAAKTRRLTVRDIHLDNQLKGLCKGGEEKWKYGAPQEDILSRGVYVNESTSRSTRQLFQKVRKLRESGLIERAWTFKDSVFVRVSGRDRPLCIRSHVDIDELCYRKPPNEGPNSIIPTVLPPHPPSKAAAVFPNCKYAVPTSNSFAALSTDVFSSTPISAHQVQATVTAGPNPGSEEGPARTSAKEIFCSPQKE